ncbi:MAG: adenylate/guanylate cyclase domain-containing protein [Pseudomonadota bacterium]
MIEYFSSLFKARLSWKITFWVFIAIVVSEVIILLPSAQRREAELLQQLESVGFVTLAPLLKLQNAEVNPNELLEAAHSLHNMNFPVLGGVIYDRDGKQLLQFGKEIPDMAHLDTMATDGIQRHYEGARYDVVWPADDYELAEEICQTLLPSNGALPDGMMLSLRFDASSVQTELMAYLWRIAGLVGFICLIVTGVTMLALTPTVINPILQLHKAILELENNHAASAGSQLQEMGENRKDELGKVLLAFDHMQGELNRYVTTIEENEKSLAHLVNELSISKQQAEDLLLNVLPVPIADQLKQGVSPIAESFPEATVLFADIVGFTTLSTKIPATELVELLNQIFTRFDHLAERHGLEKIKTIGDAYMVVGGLPTPDEKHACAMAEMALDMLEAVQEFNTEYKQSLQVRIGINSGPVIAGVIGIKKFIYDLWGDTVNIASRMESHGLVGSVQVSESTWTLIKDEYEFNERGCIDIKGRGKMNTYLLLGRMEALREKQAV